MDSSRVSNQTCNVSVETDDQETRIRRQFEEVRMRLEQDLNRLVHDLEMIRNGRIKKLKKLASELQTTAAKLEDLSRQVDEMRLHGTAAEVIEECANDMSTSRVVELLSQIPEPADNVQLRFNKSDLLQQADNLVGELMSSKCMYSFASCVINSNGHTPRQI